MELAGERRAGKNDGLETQCGNKDARVCVYGAGGGCVSCVTGADNCEAPGGGDADGCPHTPNAILRSVRARSQHGARRAHEWARRIRELGLVDMAAHQPAMWAVGRRGAVWRRRVGRGKRTELRSERSAPLEQAAWHTASIHSAGGLAHP